MGILSRSAVVAALFAGVYSLQAFEQRTLYFNIPTAQTYPQFSAPSFPPTPTGPAQFTEWLSYDGDSSIVMGLPTGGTAGLQVPNLGQVFSTFSVPAALRGNLASITLQVQYFTSQTFTFTRTEEDGVITANTTQTLKIYDFVAPGMTEDPFFVPSGNVLTRTLAMSGTATLSGAGDVETAFDSETDTPQTVTLSSGANFNIAGATNTPAFFTMPVDFRTAAGAITGGNAGVDYTPFGAALFSITYTFVPESDLAWAGLPLVIGGWFVRRRMIASKNA